MSDRPLVERLRGPDWNVCDKHTVCYCIEAADAIERMEEKCRIADLHEDRRATELMEAKRKVAELEEDRRRIEWLEAHTITEMERWPGAAHIVYDDGEDLMREDADTLRDAIDAARKGGGDE